jgi:hypothetical protein
MNVTDLDLLFWIVITAIVVLYLRWLLSEPIKKPLYGAP